MAMLAPALRWPDILPSAWQASMQGQLDAILPSSGPLSNLTPSFLVSLFVSLVTLSLLLSLRSRSSLHPHAHAASVASGSQRSSRRKVVGDATVLLTGPSNSGKTSLALSLSLPRASSSSSSSSSIVPKTHTSQVISRLLSRTTSSSSRSFTLVDVPGDNRLLHLRDKQLNSVSSSSNNAQKIDAIVFCVDSASGNLNAAGRRESIGIAHAADQLHTLLSILARQSTSSRKLQPVPLLILFTRSDLSPLLSTRSTIVDPKRRTAALLRLKNSLEVELNRRRAALGLGNRESRVEDMGVIHSDASYSSAGIFAWVRRALGMRDGSGASQATPSKHVDERRREEEEEEERDYVAWEDRLADFSFEKMDEQILEAGRAHFCLASVDVAQQADQAWKVDDEGVVLEREKYKEEEEEEKGGVLNSSSEFDGTLELSRWIDAL